MLGTRDTEARMFGEHHIRCPAEQCLLKSKEHTELLKVFEQVCNKTGFI